MEAPSKEQGVKQIPRVREILSLTASRATWRLLGSALFYFISHSARSRMSKADVEKLRKLMRRIERRAI